MFAVCCRFYNEFEFKHVNNAREERIEGTAQTQNILQQLNA